MKFDKLTNLDPKANAIGNGLDQFRFSDTPHITPYLEKIAIFIICRQNLLCNSMWT